MKNIYRYLIFVLAVSLFACSKDGGYYSPEVIDKEYKGSTLEYLKSKPGVYDSLLSAVGRLGLESVLSDSNTTLFAVTNPSFQLAFTNLNNLYAISEKPAQYLATVDSAQLDTMVTQYIIKGAYNSDSLKHQDGLALTSVRQSYPMHARVLRATSSGFVDGGPEIIEILDTKRSQFNRDWIGTTTGSINIKTKNGIVHVVTPDHVFGFEDFITRLTFVPAPPNLFSIIGGTHSVSRESGGGADGVEGSNNVIDGNPETKFFIGWDPKEVSLTFELNEPAVAGAYTITSANDLADRDPVDWNLQASMNGENWVTLDTKTNQAFEQRMQQRIFYFKNIVPYKFFRLNITRNNGSSGMQLADWSVNSAK